jgi:hypothetical protein
MPLTSTTPSAQVTRRRYGVGKLFALPAGTLKGAPASGPYAPAGTANKFTLGVAAVTNVPGSALALPLGITADGMTFTGTMTTENDEAAEYTSPIRVFVTGQSETLAVELKTTNLAIALNLTPPTTVPDATTPVNIRKPALGSEVRTQLLWVSQDADLVLVLYSCLQTGDLAIAGKKGAAGITLPLTFTCEQPDSSVSGASYDIWALGASWAATANTE